MKKNPLQHSLLLALGVCCALVLNALSGAAADNTTWEKGYVPHVTLTIPDSNDNKEEETQDAPLRITIRQYDDEIEQQPPARRQPQPTITIQDYQNSWTKAPPPSYQSNGQRQQENDRDENRIKIANEHVPDGPYQSGPYEISGVKIIDIHTGKVMPVYSVNLKPTIERIEAGIKNPHPNDGSIFRNLSHKLPKKSRNYYREYVVPTKGIRGPGPQRLIIGERGEMYYTSDHYESFVNVERE